MFAGKLVITIRLEYEWAASELPFHIPNWNAVRKESKGNIVECYLTKEVEVVNGNRKIFQKGYDRTHIFRHIFIKQTAKN